jgi:putative hemolysin
VQIGITLVGILAGAFGGRTLAHEIIPHLNRMPLISAYSAAVAVAIVVICITYFSVVLGELVPKRIALRHPEGISRMMESPMRVLSKPIVWLLSVLTDAIFKLLGGPTTFEPPMTEEEIKNSVQQGVPAGVFEDY